MSQETSDPNPYNLSKNEPFSNILDKVISRRGWLINSGSAAASLGILAPGGFLQGCGRDKDESQKLDPKLSFKSVSGSKTDAVVIPDGYTAQVFAPWGTPINPSAKEWKSDGGNSSEDQINSMGMHHDGIFYFPINGSSTEGILCVNHEYIDKKALHADGEKVGQPEWVRKEINAHGVSVIRIRLKDGNWSIVKNDALNRRITGASEMKIAGPLAGASSMITPFSPKGDRTRGTLNNCGSGWTPWGSFLTCEENWPGYFVVDESHMTPAQKRLGISSLNQGWYNWHLPAGHTTEANGEFSRFNLTPKESSPLKDYRNEGNGFGYVVEIDPYDPKSLPVKRTALGRFRHESVVYGQLKEGQPITWYSGHDSRFEYLYKFVSKALWNPSDAKRSDRLEVGSKYLDEGTLYAARFNEKGKGTWLPLNAENPSLSGFGSLENILLNTPGAADAVGATPMDRPEWIAVDPETGRIYMTLTNNSKRDGSKGKEADHANPRINNAYGHIIQWDESSNSDTSFNWDIFVFGAPADSDPNTNRSKLTQDNQFASPDGLVFDNRGILWIQTDNGAKGVKKHTNDQMLAVVPSTLKSNEDDPAVIHQHNQAQLKRFFVGPNGCEVTGCAFTPDHRNFFINIQHPSNWPAADEDNATIASKGKVRPRSSTVVIRRKDGGLIGT